MVLCFSVRKQKHIPYYCTIIQTSPTLSLVINRVACREQALIPKIGQKEKRKKEKREALFDRYGTKIQLLCFLTNVYCTDTGSNRHRLLGCRQAMLFLFASARFANAADDAWRCHKQQGRGHQCYDTQSNEDPYNLQDIMGKNTYLANVKNKMHVHA